MKDVPHVVSGATFFFFFLLLAELGSSVCLFDVYFKRVVLCITRNTVPETKILINVSVSIFLTFSPKKNNILNCFLLEIFWVL